jgi:DNA-directed RNA polymerase sigma subunit (sigma70/sigma32)
MNLGKQVAPMSHADIAKVFGVSRSKIQYIERNAMEKIKEALEKRGIKPQDLLDMKGN